MQTLRAFAANNRCKLISNGGSKEIRGRVLKETHLRYKAEQSRIAIGAGRGCQGVDLAFDVDLGYEAGRQKHREDHPWHTCFGYPWQP